MLQCLTSCLALPFVSRITAIDKLYFERPTLETLPRWHATYTRPMCSNPPCFSLTTTYTGLFCGMTRQRSQEQSIAKHSGQA